MASSKNLRSSRSMRNTRHTGLQSCTKSAGKFQTPSITSHTTPESLCAALGEAAAAQTPASSAESPIADEDDEMMDVFAPSGETTLLEQAENVSRLSDAPSTTFREVPGTSQAGPLPHSRIDDSMRNESMDYDTNDPDMTENGSGRLVDDLGNYELTNDMIEHGEDDDANSESGSSATSVGGLDVENDDGYDDIDNISSNGSDDSAAFEAEIEREIQAEGEHGIDWDDEQTYQYNENWNTGLYDLDTSNAMMEPVADFDLYQAFHPRQTLPAPEVPKPPAFEDFTDKAFFDDDSSSSVVDTPESSPQPSLAAPLASSFVDPMQVEGHAELDGDETDDDEELEANESTINSPSPDISSRRESRLLNRRPQYSADEADLPPMRKIACNPRRAVAVTTDTPMGRYIQYLTPRGRAYRWITLRRSAPNSRPDSALSSPTMINFDDAIMHGNTRTGAHVTDIIHGYAFALRHCRRRSADETTTPTPNRFYERFHYSFNQQDHQTLDELDAAEQDVMQLVDFSECVEPAMPTASPSNFFGQAPFSGLYPTNNMLDPITDDILRTPAIQTSQQNDLNTTTSLTDGLRALPLNDSTSPKKRRLSSRSNTMPDLGMSPLEKRARLTGLGTAVDYTT